MTWWLVLLIAVGYAVVIEVVEIIFRRRPRTRRAVLAAVGAIKWPDPRHVLCPRCGCPRFLTPPARGVPTCVCQEPPVAGYANRVITLDFSEEFAEKGDDGKPTEKIFVAIRNPRQLTAAEITPRDVALDADGKPLDLADAQAANSEMIAKLIVAWRVYDPTDLAIDPDTGEPGDQALLPTPATPELVAKLPVPITMRIAEQVAAAVNPG